MEDRNRRESPRTTRKDLPAPQARAAAAQASAPNLASSDSLPAVGAIERLGNTDLCSEIATGGMATIYLGVQRGAEGFEKMVAVKKLLPSLAGNADFIAMLVDEARISARARHPYVRDVFQVSMAPDGAPYLVMEFLVGEPLSKIARALAGRRDQARPETELSIIARVMAHMCEGLHAVHELSEGTASLGIVHRDITPQNLFVLHDGTVRITDFGVAQGRGRRQQTRGRTLKGKLSYMSPEYLSHRPYDRRSDVWALGVVLWEVLTGQRLFRRGSDAATVAAILDEGIPAPSTVRGDVDRRLDDIVLTALRRDPDRRYATALELGAELEKYVAHRRQMVASRDVGRWLSELLPQSLPTLNALMDSARRVKAGPASVRENAPIASKIANPLPRSGERAIEDGTVEVIELSDDQVQSLAPSSVEEVTRPFELVRRRPKESRSSADVLAAPTVRPLAYTGTQ